ncbi:hypothetical protein [Gracilibacillus salinarum]|uniref:Uncharacterized protein n=1 Tax=Gracilibacillus salinarum TaxID=2932255 RepID=A0ABY4GKW0_9BACI|nr:hypothetical protein [Gracilibacillus salinarum]UOQ84856.1 hypothetical protein MUN87_19725 [Gracilibacillus salinarum]
MNFYEKLPDDVLIQFYEELNKSIELGHVTKSSYYELGLIISVLNSRNINTEQPVSELANDRISFVIA